MSNNWVFKYKSSNLDDFDTNKTEINKIIYSMNEPSINSIIVKGDTGIGKNNIINLIAKKFKYKIYRYKLQNKKLISLENVYNNFNKKEKHLVIINKVDYITTITEKKNIQNLNKIISNQKNSNIFVIFLIEKTLTKSIKELNKNSELIELNYPSTNLLNNIINRIIINEKLQIEQKVINVIINLCQKDIRRLILIIKDLKLTFNDNLITLHDFNKFLKYTTYKTKNENILDTTKLIINEYNYEKCVEYYNNEKVILPLMLYENYIYKLKFGQDSKLEILNIINKINKLVCIADIIETNIYTDQNWYLQNIHGYISIISTSFLINNYNNNKIDDININYSSDLNKTSLKNINKKNYNNIKNLLNKDFNEILKVNYLLCSLLINNKLNNIVNYFENYNLNFKLIDMIVKINKVNKYTINNIKKKTIQKIIN